jgi:hypothetical protein
MTDLWRAGTTRLWLGRSCWAGIVAVGLLLKALQSPLYIFGADDDDELMVRMAQGFLRGHWSSTFSTTGAVTLTKPIGFPVFLAVVHFLPWSPLVSNYMLYLVGAGLVAWSWRRLSGSRAQATVVLAALAFNPILFATDSQQVYREVFIDAVATVAIGLSFVVAAEVMGRRPGAGRQPSQSPVAASGRDRSNGSHARIRWAPFALAAVIGLAVGVVAVTKPTWQWLALAIAAPLVVPLVEGVRRSGNRPSAVLRVVLAVLLAVGGALGVVETTKAMNKRAYGVALVEDFSTGSVARAWKAWASVEAGPPRHDVAFTEPMRIAVYRISPTAAEMEPYFKSPSDLWKQVDCSSPAKICDESGNWFEWDLRSAAVATGRINSVRDLQDFFTTVANDIEHACTSGELRCTSSPVLATGLPPLNQISGATVASDTADGMARMLSGRLAMGPPIGPQPSLSEYRLWASVVPGMSSIQTVERGTSPTSSYSVLRVLDTLYEIGNLLLAAVLCLGPVLWAVRRLRRCPRGRERADLNAAGASGLFLVSAIVGMATLAVFEA